MSGVTESSKVVVKVSPKAKSKTATAKKTATKKSTTKKDK